MQPQAAGNCRASFQRFHFDKQTGKCISFIYTGCGGNDNHFNSEEECYLKCNNVLQKSDSVTIDAAPFPASGIIIGIKIFLVKLEYNE